MPVKPKYPRPTEETTTFSGRRLLITLSVVALGAALALVTPPAIAAPPAEAVDAIGARYAEAGGPASPLGAPSGGAVDVPGGALQDYAGGAIYYSPDSGAKIMYGEILKKYRALGVAPVNSDSRPTTRATPPTASVSSATSPNPVVRRSTGTRKRAPGC